MAILVDDPLWTRWGRRWSHLVSDTAVEELHAFARDLGLPARAFHRDHYDLPEEQRPRAVAMGAQPVGSRELVRRLRAAGLRHRPESPVTGPDQGDRSAPAPPAPDAG